MDSFDDVPDAHVEVFEDGCQHACAHCEARRRHEFLGFGAGTDFDTKLVLKLGAPDFLRIVLKACERSHPQGVTR